MTVKIKDVTDGFIKEIETLKSERDALAAQAYLLKDSINKCTIDNVALLRLSPELKQIVAATPQQCLRDVKAEAGRAGFIAGFNESGEGFNGEYGVSEKRIHQLADEYAAAVRQCGAE